ncbi:MAG TPA: DUF4253 domain-containing protein [Acidimicrobiales bacterium]
MIDEATGVEALLQGTALAGRPVERAAYVGPDWAPRPPVADDPVLFVRCEPDEIASAWRAARSVVDRTGRWPVVTAGWAEGRPLEAELFDRVGRVADLPAPLADDELDERLGARFAQRDSFRFDHDDRLRYELDVTARSFGSAPSLAEVGRSLGPDPGRDTLDRWLFGWEQALVDGGAAGGLVDDTYLKWFVPARQPCCVVLMPTATGWEAGALLDFYGASHLDGWLTVLVSLLRRWQERWGAEIVASFGTMLELAVSSPPTEPQDLIDLAVEQCLLASCTTLLPGIHLRQHARVLAGRSTWFLHERP